MELTHTGIQDWIASDAAAQTGANGDFSDTRLAGLEFRGYDGGSAVFLEGGAGSLGALLLGVSVRL